MAKLNFQHHYSSLVSHDPSEIVIICWYDGQATWMKTLKYW